EGGCQSWVYTTSAPAERAHSSAALSGGKIPSAPLTCREPRGCAKSFCTSTTMRAVEGPSMSEPFLLKSNLVRFHHPPKSDWGSTETLSRRRANASSKAHSAMAPRIRSQPLNWGRFQRAYGREGTKNILFLQRVKAVKSTGGGRPTQNEDSALEVVD